MKPTVVYGSDGNDLEMLKASLYSVCKFMPDVDVYVLSDSVTPQDVPGAKVADPTGILSGLGFFPDRWGRKPPYATLYRLAIPLMQEFSEMDRILYLDTDTLVKCGDAMELFSAELGTCEVLGTRDTVGRSDRIDRCIRGDLCQEAMVAILSRLWANRDIAAQTYINAGVTVWNLAQIRANGLDWYSQRLRWFWEAELRGRFKYLDQDLVNSMMDAKTDMPCRFNAYASQPYGQKYDHVSIQHYVDNSKDRVVLDAMKMGYAPDGGDRIVVYSSDGRDADRLRMSMRSAKKFLGPGTRFFILTELQKYPGADGAVLLNPAPVLADVGFTPEGWNRKWPYCTLFRLALPLMPELSDMEKVLYLDTDVLVRSQDAGKLFSLPFDSFEVCGVPDVEARQGNTTWIVKHGLRPEARLRMQRRFWRRAMPETRMYINAGVTVWNLSTIRGNGLDWYGQRLRWFWEEVSRGGFKYLDQDFINAMMDACPALSTKFNKFGGDVNTDCAVQHFVAGTKKGMAETARRIGC